MAGKTKTTKTDQWFSIGYQAHQAGDLKKAEQYYQRILRQQPTDAEVLYLFGTICLQQKHWPEAIKLLTRARKLRPRHVETLNNLGMVLYETGDLINAKICLQEAIIEKPDYAYAHNNLARIFEHEGAFEDAVVSFSRATELDSSYIDAYYNLGLLLKKLDRFPQAEAALCHALKLAPDQTRIWNDLCTVHKARGRLAEAEYCVREALKCDPKYFESWNNLGAILQERGEFSSALIAYQKAEILRPEDPMPSWNQAFALLSLGRLVEGWEQYEIRWKALGEVELPCLPWEGESLPDAVLLILAEQGLGDEIRFASCVPETTGFAGQVILQCDPRLAPLFTRSFSQVRIIGANRATWDWLSELPPPDRAICMGSLPRLFRTSIDSFPKTPGYLYADPKRITYWRQRLASFGENIKIGICWRSSLSVGERHKYYATLEEWKPLFSIEGIRFINLQYDECVAELVEASQRFGLDIVNFPDLDLRNDQDELAALMSALDLIISADTAVAALAGALGKLTWCFSTSIAWTALGTNHDPWFPNTRLFIRDFPDDPWLPLFEGMATDLRQWIANHPPQSQESLLAEKAMIPAMTRLMASNYMALALKARATGGYDEAQSYCQQVLGEDPEYADAWHLLGVILRERGSWEDALAVLNHAQAIHPQEPTIQINRGRVLQDLQRTGPALEAFRAALELDKACVEARISLGELLDAQGEWDEALDVLRPALALAAQDSKITAELHYALAQTLHHQRRLVEAEQHLREALRLSPAYSGAHNGLGNVLRDQNRLDEALACYQAALTLRPNLPEFHNNLGNALRELNRLHEAEKAYREALRLRPHYADAWSNLGNLLRERGARHDAIHAYRRALEIAPEDAATRWNIAFSLLWEGELTEGWAAYEWRWRTGAQPPLPQQCPEWHGEELIDQCLLILPEQGLGDEIMFASCIPDILARAKHTVVACQQRLAALYARSFPTATVVALPTGVMQLPANLPSCDFQVALGSLPRLLRVRVEDFPNRLAYLKADPLQVEYWRSRLAGLGPGLKIGFCWRSGLLTDGRRRLYPTIVDYEPILRTPGVVFINLQYDDCAKELTEAHTHFAVTIHSFSDLDLRNDQDSVAALIVALDGVISAPTAVSELAGALGVPVLRYGVSWTSLGTQRMPWHPTMRLFDKPDLEQPWTPTLKAMASALGEWAAQGITQPDTFADIAPQLIETHHGRMLIAGSGAMARNLLQTGEYAPKALALLMSLLRPGDWIIEVGSGLGAFTLPLARAVGVNGLVIACEPDGDAFQLLCANIALSKIKQIHAECLALDATRPVVGANADIEWRRKRLPKRETLDALALPRCDLLRIGTGIDALAILAGAQTTLDWLKPFIHIEACTALSEVGKQLLALGYAWQLQHRTGAYTDVLAYPTAKSSNPP